MPRKKKKRCIEFIPKIKIFCPKLDEEIEGDVVVLNIDELEAIRLKDLKKLTQEEAANRMGVSQPTFHRLLTSARKKIAEALIEGKNIIIREGDYR